MKPFQLDTVLNYRKRCEDEALKALMESMEARDALVRARKAAAQEIRLLLKDLDAAKCEDVRIDELILYESCIARKKREEALLEQKIGDAQAEVQEKNAQLVAARQEKRALELLKERRQSEERRRQELAEKKSMDEIAVIRYGGGR
jgi:flagellar export protein FliJ